MRTVSLSPPVIRSNTTEQPISPKTPLTALVTNKLAWPQTWGKALKM